jgi:Crinkler effector protein N-terminal domain
VESLQGKRSESRDPIHLRPATMSQSDIYTILCVVDNEDVAFSVEIDKNEIIGQLKQKIFKKMATFANMDPESLDLYHVDIPDASRAQLKASVKNERLDSPQLPTKPLIEIFPTGPKPHTVHFIVKSAERTPFNLSLSSLSTYIPTRDNKLKKRITEFAINLRSTFKIFLTNNVQPPLWEPLWGSEEVRSHITGLKIPLMSQSPSLLLHNLGQLSHDAQLVERIDKLFSPRSGKR